MFFQESRKPIFRFRLLEWHGAKNSDHILELCARTSSVCSLAVFRNANRTSPGAGMTPFFLFQLRLMSFNCVFHCSNRVIRRLFLFLYCKEYNTNQNVRLRCAECTAHTAWVIDKTQAAQPLRMGGFRSPGASHLRFPLAARMILNARR
jgi:hypothetical protein